MSVSIITKHIVTLRKCHNTPKKFSWNVTDDNSILDTESETLMGVPGLVSLQQAATRSVCSYDGYECHSPMYILHARVVSLATLDCFTLCRVIDSGSTTYTHLLSGYYCLAHIHCLAHISLLSAVIGACT